MLPHHSDGMKRLHVDDARQACSMAVCKGTYNAVGGLRNEIRAVEWVESRMERIEFVV